MDLSDDVFMHYMRNGMAVEKLALAWKERLFFDLDCGLAIRRLRGVGDLQEAFGSLEAEDAAARFDAEFALTAGELAEFVPALLKAFGGLARE